MPIPGLGVSLHDVGRFVAIDAVRRLVAGLPGFASGAQLQEVLDGMDLEGLHDIQLEEFQELMALLADDGGGRSIAETFRAVLTAYFLSLKDWDGQLRCVLPADAPRIILE